MTEHDFDFQFVTENIAGSLDEKVRVLENAAPSWNFIVIFSAILTLVLIKQLAPKRLKLVTSMLYQNFDIDKVGREWNPMTSIIGFAIAISYIALLALFIQKSICVFSSNALYSGGDFYVQVCIFTGAFILVQYLFVNATGWLFQTRLASQHQSLTHLSMATSLCLVLPVLLLVMTFYPLKFCVIAGLVIITTLTALRIGKTFIAHQLLIKGVTLKIFLYFCALEIIPFSIAMTMAIRVAVTNSVL